MSTELADTRDELWALRGVAIGLKRRKDELDTENERLRAALANFTHESDSFRDEIRHQLIIEFGLMLSRLEALVIKHPYLIDTQSVRKAIER